MSDIIVARRYAQALYTQAQEAGAVEQVDADVEAIRQSLEDSRELVLFFQSPVIARGKKESVIEALFGDRVQPTTMQFLRLLVDKKREDIFLSIVDAYRTLRDEQQNITEATVRTAQPLDSDEERQLREALEAMTGSRVRLKVRHDDSLMGGVIIRVGDTVYDGSVRHQLETLREKLEHGAFTN